MSLVSNSCCQTRSETQDWLSAVFPNCVERPYRFMFEKLMDKAAVLDMRIDEMSEKLVRKHKLLASSEEQATKGRAHVLRCYRRRSHC